MIYNEAKEESGVYFSKIKNKSWIYKTLILSLISIISAPVMLASNVFPAPFVMLAVASVFNVLLPSVETKKVIPSDYRLFQVADFICTMKLTELKLKKHNMSIQELRFFGGEDGVIKNYLKDLKKYELN